MAALELFHRIYTHASSVWQPGGGRFARVDRDAEGVLPDAALKELDELLTTLAPEGTSPAWAMRSFGGGRESYACVAVAYLGFEDDQGRNGLLKHARVVRLDAGEPWFNPVPLIDEASAFPIDEVLQAPPSERLRKYLDLLPSDRSIAVPALTVPALDSLPPDFLHDVLLASLATLGSRRATRVEIPNASLENVALAAASLPVGLQRRSSWAFEAVNSAPVDVIWSASSGVPAATVGTPAVDQCVRAYLKLLLDTSFNPEPLMSEDGMRDAPGLQRFLQKTAVAGAAGDSVMSNKNRNRPKREPARIPPQNGAEGPDPELLESLDRQHQAIYHSLRGYIDQRLAAYDVVRHESGLSRAAAPATAHGRRDDSRLWRGIAAAVALTAILIIGGQYLWEWLRTREPEPVLREEIVQSTTTTEPAQTPPPAQPSAEREAVRKLIAAAETNGKWAEAVATLSEQHATLLAAMIDRVANGQDVTPKVRDELVGCSRRLKLGRPPLDGAARGVLRPLLFEFVVKSEDDIQAVDGALDDVDAALLRKAKDRWGVKSTSTDVNDREIHSELILRWLEGNLP